MTDKRRTRDACPVALAAPARGRRFVVVVGAGGSAGVGLPLMPALRRTLPERPKRGTPEANAIWRRECCEVFVEAIRPTLTAARQAGRPTFVAQWLQALRDQRCVVTVFTTNIDGLLPEALELHGSIHRRHCALCRAPELPGCGCGPEWLVADLVLYGDLPHHEMEFRAALAVADVAVVVGLSGVGVSTWNTIASHFPIDRPLVRVDPEPKELYEEMRQRIVINFVGSAGEFVRAWLERHGRASRSSGLRQVDLLVEEREGPRERPRRTRRREKEGNEEEPRLRQRGPRPEGKGT